MRPAAIESAVAELWTLGTLGLEQRECGNDYLVHAYFQLPSALPVRATEPGGRYWEKMGVDLYQVETVAEDDWLAEYRRHAAVFDLGRRFLVDPREPGSPPPVGDERVLLQLPARRAFGTGSHESTSLVVEWLESQRLAGTTILDVGTGTGILSFVALHLGAQTVVSVEIDPAAGIMARINQALNQVRLSLVVGGVAALAASAEFDLLLVNVLPQRIAGDLERLATLVRPGGRAIFSGILGESSREVQRRLEGFGFAGRERLSAGEWVALVVEREVI